jgi:cobalt-zinc-cadmium resistance protein CzcA
MIRGGNAREVVNRIKLKVEEINEGKLLPDGLQIVPFYDRTDLVNAAMFNVAKVLVEGVILVIILLFLFLGDVRSSLIVVATLLLTPLLTFLVMNRYGISANLMSLGGLAIAIGIMVDGSVVVVENTFAKLGERLKAGESKNRIILEAASEVGTPVLFGVGIIILVFMPLLSLEGMEGKMFAPMAITIAIALAISLILSFTLSPVLCSYILKGGSEDDTRLVKKLRAPYERWLHWSLAHPKLVVKRSFIALGISLLGFVLLGKAFIPAIKRIMTIPGVEMAVSRLGKGESPADPGQPNESDPIVTLKPLGDRDLSQEEIAQKIREKLKTLPGIELAISQPIAARVDEMVSGVRSQVAVKIFGEDLAVLQKLGSQIGQILTKMKGSNDLRIEQASGQNYLNIKIDRDAIARYGINVADVNEVIETAIGGKQASTVYEGERRFPLVLRYPASYRNKIDAVENIVLSSPNGAQVLMRDLAEISLVEGPAQISRESGRRRLVVGVNVEGRDLGGFVQEAQELIAKNVELPQGYSLQWGGQFENMQRAMSRLMVIIPLTILAIFFLLFMLFKSIRLASLIILVLPFASIGGVFGLFLTGEYLSVPAAVGFINLWGIAVLNGVVLISFIKQLREDGYSIEDALLYGCGHRFRPVMMTASVAMLALVPMLFSGGPGSEVTRPLAAVVIAGLVTSTALTLLVLPVLYRWFEEKEVEA